MKKILKRLLSLIFTVIPVLCLTSTAADAALCCVAVILSFAMAVTVKSFSTNIVPANVKNIVILIFIALAVSLCDIILRPLLPVTQNVQFLPLCAVSVVLLLGMTDMREGIKARALHIALSGGLFAVITLVLGILRELLGMGTVFNLTVTKKLLKPAAIFSLPAGAIFIVAVVIAVINRAAKEEKPNA